MPEDFSTLLTNILLLTFLFEAITVIGRFVLRLKANRFMAWLGDFTFGYRVHHSYWGVVLLIVLLLLPLPDAYHQMGVAIGWALILSDLIHHFLVLWPIVGRHEFYIKFSDEKRDVPAKID